MKQKIMFFIFIISCFFHIPFLQAQSDALLLSQQLGVSNPVGKLWFVFIAINQYREWPNLRYPVSDAKSIEDIIKKRYYYDEIVRIYDQEATKRYIAKLFLDLQEKVNTHDSLLIYYAGHGWLDKNSNTGFWIPFDAGLDNIDQRNWLPNSQIRGYISKMKSMHICLIIDACFSGDVLEIDRGKPENITIEYFRKSYKRTSRQVLTSGAIESVPDRSEFALLLSQTLEKNISPYMDPLMLFEQIRLGIHQTTPLLGNLKFTGHQNGASFLLFLKEPVKHVVREEEIPDYSQNDVVFTKTDKNQEAFHNMAFVTGGSYKMGTNDRANDEWPAHEVVISDFYMGKYEVTFHEYIKFCSAAGKIIPKDNGWERDKKPVIYVSWYDAVEYCNWLSHQYSLTPCYTINGKEVSCDFNANGYRLPTEAEWEYAAGGGNKGRGYTYAAHNDPSWAGWYNQNSGGQTHPIGTRRQNELGLFDMSGNVWEWCWDYYSDNYYKSSSVTDPSGPESGKKRVLRGGSWYNGSNYLRITVRGYANPGAKDDYFGFRVVRRK